MAPSFMSLLWFVLVLLMVPVGLLLLKRTAWGRQLANRTQPAARVLGSTVIGPQQRLLSVEVGEGEHRRWLLLGVTPQQISHLMTSDVPLRAPALDPVGPSPAEPFRNILARWRPDPS